MGWGAGNILSRNSAFPWKWGDLLTFARTVEEVLAIYADNPARLIDMGKKASDYIGLTYTREREEEDVLSFWKSIV